MNCVALSVGHGISENMDLMFATVRQATRLSDATNLEVAKRINCIQVALKLFFLHTGLKLTTQNSVPK